MCTEEVCKCVCITAFLSDGLISSCDAIERAVFLLLVNTHAHTHTHAHTLNLETAFDLHSCQFSHDTYPHTPTHAHTRTYTHTVQRNCPPNYLVSLGAVSSKRRERAREKEGGLEEEEEEKRKKRESWEKKGTAATSK